MKAMNQLIKKFSFLRKNSTYDQALEYYHRGNFEKAIKVFQKVIANPKKAGVYYNLSLFHIKESYLNLGFAYEHMGMYEEAVKNFASAAQIEYGRRDPADSRSLTKSQGPKGIWE